MTLTESERASARERQRLYRQRHPDRVAAYCRRYREEHPGWSAEVQRLRRQEDGDRLRTRDNAYRAAHKDEENAAKREAYAANPEPVRQKVREYRESRPGFAYEVTKRWREGHPQQARELSRSGTAVRKARQAEQLCTHDECLTVGVFRLVWRVESHECYLCGTFLRRKVPKGQPGYVTYDHVHPVSKGGLHCFDNVMPACEPCNYGKTDRLLADFRPDLAHLDLCCPPGAAVS